MTRCVCANREGVFGFQKLLNSCSCSHTSKLNRTGQDRERRREVDRCISRSAASHAAAAAAASMDSANSNPFGMKDEARVEREMQRDSSSKSDGG